jgi:hypothetical protein
MRGVFHIDISFSCWFRGIRVPFCFLESLEFLPGNCESEVFIAEKVVEEETRSQEIP